MATIARLAVALDMDSRDFDNGVKNAMTSAEGLANKLAGIGKNMTAGITLPIVGAAGAALKFSTDFNSSMANVASLGVPTARVNELKAAVQSMAITTGQSTEDLAGGLYQTVSAFGDTADTAKILEINAKAAAAGLSTVPESIALTSAVTKGYGDTSANAVQQVSDLALQTVALGQTTFPELAASIGRVTPLAASLGVTQEELFAVMATGTGVTGGAAEVSTQLRGVLQSLMAPTEDMTTLMGSMGYETGDAMLQGEGLEGTIQAIVQAAAASGTPLQKYLGSIEGQTLALALAGPQAEAYAAKLEAMGGSMGATEAAFKAQTQGINKVGFTMKQLGIQATVIMQKLGDGLAPALGVVLETVTPLVGYVVQLADWFANADANTQLWGVALLGVVAAIGPLLMILPGVVSAIGVIGSVLAFLVSPIGLVIAAIGALVAVFATDFMGIRTMTMQALQPVIKIAGEVGSAFQSLMAGDFAAVQAKIDTIKTDFGNLVKSITDIDWGGLWGKFQAWIDAWATAIATSVTSIDWGGLVATAGDWLAGLRNSVVGGITSIDWGGALTTAGDFLTSLRDGIVGAVTSVDWGGALATAGDWIAGLRDGVVGAVTSIDWGAGLAAAGEFVTGLKDGVIGAVTSIDWGGGLAAAGSWVDNLRNQVVNRITTINWGQKLSDAGDFLAGLKNKVVAVIQGIDWTPVQQALQPFITAITTGLAPVQTSLEGFDLGTAIAGIGTAATEMRDNLLAKMTTALTEMDITGAITGWISSMTTSITNTDWSSVGATVGSALSAALNPENLKLAAAAMAAGIAPAVTGSITGVTWAMDSSNWTKFAEAVKTSLTTIDWGAVGESLQGLNTAIMTALGEFGAGFTSGFKTPDWLNGLLNWKFPSPSELLNWGWPVEYPTWSWPITYPEFRWPEIGMPGWVEALLNWNPLGQPDAPATGNAPNTGYQNNIDVTPPPPTYNGQGLPTEFGGTDGAANGRGAVVLNNYGNLNNAIDVAVLKQMIREVLEGAR